MLFFDFVAENEGAKLYRVMLRNCENEDFLKVFRIKMMLLVG
jgi:hypothetical protein